MPEPLEDARQLEQELRAATKTGEQPLGLSFDCLKVADALSFLLAVHDVYYGRQAERRAARLAEAEARLAEAEALLWRWRSGGALAPLRADTDAFLAAGDPDA